VSSIPPASTHSPAPVSVGHPEDDLLELGNNELDADNKYDALDRALFGLGAV
jgi:hypothetical protein